MKKRTYIWIASILLLFITTYIILDAYITKKLDHFLTSELSLVDNLSYEDISVSLLSGDVHLDGVQFEKDSLEYSSKSLKAEGFSYYNYYVKDTIVFDLLQIDSSFIDGKIMVKDTINRPKNKTNQSKNKPIKIHKVVVENLKLDIIKSNSFPLTVSKVSAILGNFSIDKNNKRTLPFSYKNVSMTIESVENTTSKLHKTAIKKMYYEDRTFTIDSLKIIPLKSRDNYIDFTPYEENLFSLTIPKIKIPSLEILDREKLSFIADSIYMENADFSVYMDATVSKNDDRISRLYSKKLRDLPFHLQVKMVKISNSRIIYEELAKKDRKAGFISFDNIEASMKNIINYSATNGNNLTKVNIKAKFMKTAPLNIEWNYNVNNLLDEFKVKGSLYSVTSKDMNSFLEPVSAMRTTGRVNELHFNLNGNDDESNGDLAIDFENFEIKLLEEGKTRKFMSWVVNLFVKNSSKEGLTEVKIENLKRDKTASFWNFLWRNIEEGLREAVR